MPALANAQNILRMDHGFQSGSQPIGGVRTFWQYAQGPPSGAECANIAAYFALAWQTYLAPQTCANQSLVLVRCTDLTAPTSFNGEWVGSYAGTRTGTELPVSQCMLVTYNIHHRYRGGKPRTYWPMGVATDVASGLLWSSAFQSQTQAALNGYWTHVQNYVGASQIGPQMCVHYYKGHQQNTTGGIWDPANEPMPYPPGSNAPIDTCYTQAAQLKIGSQKRRLTV